MNNFKVLYLTENVDGRAILKILTLNDTLNIDDSERSYYEKLATWANGQKEKIKNVDLNTLELSDRSLIGNGIPNKTNSLLGILNALNSKLGKNFNANNEIDKKVQRLTVEILAELSGIKKPIKTDSKPRLFQGMDWTAEKARRLKDPGDKSTSEILDQFYNDYYKIEYAGLKSPEENDTSGIVAKLKNLDKILIPEFQALGYNPDVNPLAQFLKILISLQKDGNNIFSRLTTNTYGAIHNSFLERHITGNMLGNYNERNILFCSDLYNYKGLDIVKYLSFQKTIKNEATKSEEYTADPWQITVKILIQQDLPSQSNGTYTEKVKALKDLSEVTLPAQGEAKLRSISEISDLYSSIFNSVLNTDETQEFDELTEIAVRATRGKVVLSTIRLILDQNDFKKAYPGQAATYEDWLENDISYKRNDKNIEKSKQILFDDDRKISPGDMLKLIKQLIKVYNASKKAKADK